MVTLTPQERAKADFARRLNERLDELDYPPITGRGRYTAVGKDLGVTYQASKKWLDGTSLPELARCVEIAKRYGLSFEWLMMGDGDKYRKTAVRRRPGPIAEPINPSGQALLEMISSLPEDQIELLEIQMRALFERHNRLTKNEP